MGLDLFIFLCLLKYESSRLRLKLSCCITRNLREKKSMNHSNETDVPNTDFEVQ